MTIDDQLQLTSPLSVLLDLIEKERLSITEVSLARVTEQYILQLQQLRHVSASILADFLSVASRLVLLKSRTLTSMPDGEEDLEEPLLEQLKLYREFRHAAQRLGEIARRNGSSYHHAMRWDEFTTFSMPPNLTLTDLGSALHQVLKDIAIWEILPKESIHDRISIRETMEKLRSRLQQQATFTLHNQSAGDSLHLLVSFLALLEMIRQREVRATQTAYGGSITVERYHHE